MVLFIIIILQVFRDDLNGDFVNLLSLKEFNQGVFVDGLYYEKEFQQVGDNVRRFFIVVGDIFLVNLIKNFNERFLKEILDICKVFDFVVNF